MTATKQVVLRTTDEVAAELRLRGGAKGVTRLIRRGDIRAVRVGREYRVPADAVRDYLAAREVRT
jgi:excisionase family DNA binding protein